MSEAKSRHWMLLSLVSLVIGLLLTLIGGAAQAQVALTSDDPLASLEKADGRFDSGATAAETETVEGAQPFLAPQIRDGWLAFQLSLGGAWKGSVDRRTGQIVDAVATEGLGLPWIPGRGNSLLPADIAQHLKGKAKPDLLTLESIARAFLPRVAPLLGVAPSALVLAPGRSGPRAGQVWLVDFNVFVGGRPIDGARVFFRIHQGNLIQLGSENLPSPGSAVPAATRTRTQALTALGAYLGGLSADDRFLDPGRLHLVPIAVSDSRFADGFAFGKGRGLAAVWQFTFKRPGSAGTWQARIDAQSGAVLELLNVNPAQTVLHAAVDFPPTASFYVGCTNLTCTADSEASGDDMGIVNYTWTWGDGSTTSGGSPVSAPTHTYAAAGTYTITLTVRDVANQTSTTSHNVTVSVGPTAAFTFSCTGRSCSVNASGSTSSVSITNYHWDWSDESVTDTASTTAAHTYAYGGSFGVSLTITDANGAMAVVTHTVTVP
jgi:PKD repeat protein